MKYFILLMVLVFSCKEIITSETEVLKKEGTNTKLVDVDYQVRAFSNIQKENDSIISRFKECINSKKRSDYRKFWDSSDTTFFKTPYVDLYNIINFDYPTYKPTIVAIQKLDNKYLFKIALMGKPEGFNSLYVIYNLYVVKNNVGEFVFQNILDETLKEWNTKIVENIKYYYNSNSTIDEKEIAKQVDFETELIKLLEVEKIDYKYIICKNNHESLSLLGYDYEDSMFFTNQQGGVTFSKEKIIFAANNKATYPHEVTHIYTYKHFPKINIIIDEGVATYLGGSKGLNYKKHIKALHKYISKNEISLSEYLFDNQKRYTVLDDSTTILYSSGALLCDLAYKKGGKKKLFDLMNSGRSDKELKSALEDIFNIDIANFDHFIENELNTFFDE